MGVYVNRGPVEVVARQFGKQYSDPLDGDPVVIAANVWLARRICDWLNTQLGPYTKYVYRYPRKARIRVEMCEYFEQNDRG